MEFEYRSVPLNLIDDADTTFRISFGASVGALEASIRRVGLINAPILLLGGSRYTIISGFARIDVCRRLGWAQIEARCLPAETSFIKRALLAIADNAGQRDLNIVEMARALGLVARQAQQDEQVDLLLSLGLSVNKDLVRMLNQILEMTDRLQAALVDGAIALPMALRLHGLKDDAAAHALTDLFQELRLGLNRQREILDWIQAVALREDLAISEILNEEPIALWRRDPNKDRGHFAQLIRHFLRSRRYPEITAYEQQYARCLKTLKLPKNIQITAPPHFEGQTFLLRLEFQTQQELLALNGEIQRIISSPVIAELLSTTGLCKS